MKATIVLYMAAVTAALSAGAAAAEPAFHPAQTAAEHTLAQILKLDADKPGQIDPTGDKAGRRPRTTPAPGCLHIGDPHATLRTSLCCLKCQRARRSSNREVQHPSGELRPRQPPAARPASAE